MKLKIENIKVRRVSRHDSALGDFIAALKQLKVGQSFLYDLKSNHRTAIQIVQHVLDRRFISRAEKTTFRVGRVT